MICSKITIKLFLVQRSFALLEFEFWSSPDTFITAYSGTAIEKQSWEWTLYMSNIFSAISVVCGKIFLAPTAKLLGSQNALGVNISEGLKAQRHANILDLISLGVSVLELSWQKNEEKKRFVYP